MKRRAIAPCTPEAVTRLCDDQGFSVSERQAQQLAEYLELLMKWNRVMNLVGANSWETCLESLVSDSLHLARYLENQTDMAQRCAANYGADDAQIWDLGAGAGLPGIPLRMFWQRGEYWLVEAREKRALFLSTVLARLVLPRTHAFHGRVEAFMPGRKAHLVLSRAFMPWREVLKLLTDKLYCGGHVLFMTRDPLERNLLPSGWELENTQMYRVGRDSRYFCSVAALPNIAPS